MQSSLQLAWDNAQSRLIEIRNVLQSHQSSQPRIIRVGQLDSELLDQELVHLLKEPLSKALGFVNESLRSRFDPELTLLIQSALYKLSIWNTGASYGAKLQDLRYVAIPSSGISLSPSGIPRRILIIHGTLTVVLPYLYTRLRSHALSRAWPDAPSTDRRRQAWGILTTLESSHALLGLLSFIIFLWDGRYRTVVDRLLGLSLVPSSRLAKRNVSYEFMNRQMVWHAFTEFLLFLLPLFSGRTVRRHLMRLVSSFDIKSLARSFLRIQPGLPTSQVKKTTRRGKYWSFPKDQCAICAENASFDIGLEPPPILFSIQSNIASSGSPLPSRGQAQVTARVDDEPLTYPIYTPYRASCGDLFCYHCLAERMLRAGEEKEVWECVRCGETVRGAERLVIRENDGDVDLTAPDLSRSTTNQSE